MAGDLTFGGPGREFCFTTGSTGVDIGGGEETSGEVDMAAAVACVLAAPGGSTGSSVEGCVAVGDFMARGATYAFFAGGPGSCVVAALGTDGCGEAF